MRLLLRGPRASVNFRHSGGENAHSPIGDSRLVPSNPPQISRVSSAVFRTQRNRQSASLRAGQHQDGFGGAPAIDELLPDCPSLQGYTVCEIDESLTAPLVKWLSKKPG
jgi:hypothetical protein